MNGKKLSLRLFRVASLLLGITFLSFMIMYLAPGDPVRIRLKRSGMMVSEETIEQEREQLGLNDPAVTQYLRWLKNILRGDLGISYKSRKSVVSLLAGALPATLLLTGLSLLAIIATATPAAVCCARAPDGLFDRLVRAWTYLFSSLPSFFVALVLLYVVSLRLSLLPVLAGGSMKGMILPVLTLTLTLGSWYVRQIRSLMLSELEKDYVKGLRTRGVPEHSIFFRHIMHNTLAPQITLYAMTFGSLLGGSAIIESIFAWNGVGKLAVDAITARDYPMIQGYVLWMAVIFLIVNAAADLCCRAADPRIRKGSGI